MENLTKEQRQEIARTAARDFATNAYIFLMDRISYEDLLLRAVEQCIHLKAIQKIDREEPF